MTLVKRSCLHHQSKNRKAEGWGKWSSDYISISSLILYIDDHQYTVSFYSSAVIPATSLLSVQVPQRRRGGHATLRDLSATRPLILVGLSHQNTPTGRTTTHISTAIFPRAATTRGSIRLHAMHIITMTGRSPGRGLHRSEIKGINTHHWRLSEGAEYFWRVPASASEE